MFRVAVRLLPVVLLSVLVLIQPGKIHSNPAVVALAPAGKSLAIWAAKQVGGYIVGKSLETLFGNESKDSERINELNRRLEVYENMLRQVDAIQATEIAKLRRSLNEKTTASDVRRIVGQTLEQLDSRVREIEGRLTDAEKRTFTLENRVAAIEELFGRITYFPPSPLLVREGGTEGKPVPHPQVKDWLNLLCQSEESRIRIMELRRDYEETAEVVQKALAEDKKVLEATQALHRKALEEVAKLMDANEIRVLKAGSPKRLPMEEKLAGMMWLVAVTKPLSDGPWKGRLGVPSALLGYQACEIVEACDLSGVKQEQLIALIQRGLLGDQLREPIFFPTKPVAAFHETFKEQATQWLRLSNQMRVSLRKSRDIDARGRVLLKEFGPRHEKMVALNKEKQTQVNRWRSEAGALEKLLASSMQTYVQAIQKGERPTNRVMRIYRDEVLQPMLAWRALMETADAEWKDRLLVEATWDRLNQKIPLPFVGALKGHTDGVTGVAWHPDGKRMLTGSFDKTAVLWDTQSGERVRTFDGIDGEVRCLTFGPGGEEFIVGLTDGTAERWRLEDAERLLTVNRHKEPILSLAIHPEGGEVLSGSGNEAALLWETSEGKVNASLSGRSTLGFLAGYKESMRAVAFSPDGKYLLTGNGDKTAFLWDAETKKKLWSFKGHTGGILCVAFRPDGKQLLTTTTEGTITVWDIDSGEVVHTLEGHEGPVFSAVFSPDGSKILSGGDDGTTRIWNVEEGKELHKFNDHSERILSVAFHPSGKRFASASVDKTVQVRELED